MKKHLLIICLKSWYNIKTSVVKVYAVVSLKKFPVSINNDN